MKTPVATNNKTVAATPVPAKTVKSANPKVNAASVENRVARRALNVGVVVEKGIPMPVKKHKSKYDFESMVDIGDSIHLTDCTMGNAAAVRATAKTKFGKLLTYYSDGATGYRFWLKGLVVAKVPGAEAVEANVEANEENKQAA